MFNFLFPVLTGLVSDFRVEMAILRGRIGRRTDLFSGSVS